MDQNFSCRGGEIDLVLLDGDTIVFAEVRYRRSRRFGSAAESVNYAKLVDGHLSNWPVPPALVVRC